MLIQEKSTQQNTENKTKVSFGYDFTTPLLKDSQSCKTEKHRTIYPYFLSAVS